MAADFGAVVDKPRNLFFQCETFACFGRIAVVDAAPELLDVAAQRLEKLLKLSLLSGVELTAATGEGLGSHNAQMVVGRLALARNESFQALFVAPEFSGCDNGCDGDCQKNYIEKHSAWDSKRIEVGRPV